MTVRRPELRNFRALLAGVSRSFYLSMRLLPQALREPVSLGYFLARAADTIADAAALPPAERMAFLASLRRAVLEAQSSQAGIPELVRTVAPATADLREQALVRRLPECLDALDRLDTHDTRAVREVIDPITRGQMLDVERFPGDGAVRALATAAELDEYTYLVAGCVGEFWTTLCERHLDGFATLPTEEMRTLGRRYGMGLQLVNIARDMKADFAMGRCYLPADEIAAAGGDARHPMGNPRALAFVRTRWIDAAAAGLECGVQYADAVRARRVRAASALPALIGLRTIALLRAPSEDPLGAVKMPRAQVRALLWGMGWTMASRGGLRTLADRMRGAS